MTEPGRDPFSQLLYPMLSPQPGAGDELVRELARAPLEKSAESNRLRVELLDEFGDEIVSAAQRMAEAFQRGGRLLALGNGGSATSAADMVTEMLVPSDGGRPIPALCLTNDIAVVTGIGNDVGFGDVFVRQIIALGRADDVVLAVSTSGNSENLVRGLGEARRRGYVHDRDLWVRRRPARPRTGRRPLLRRSIQQYPPDSGGPDDALPPPHRVGATRT